MFRRVRTLTMLPLLGAALVLGACDADDTATPADAPTAKADEGKGDAEPAAGDKEGGDEKIAGKPIDDPGKTAEVAGGGDEDRYALAIEPAEVAAGEAGKVTIKVVPKEPWHMNLEFPTSLKIEAPEGVSVDKPQQKKEDAVALTDTSCEYGVDFKAGEAGTKTFKGTFKFAVCQDEACSPVTEQLEFQVAVK